MSRRRRAQRSAANTAALLAGLLLVGCATYQGAQLYRAGSQALERGDSALAVADLEEAALLVPRAADVQNQLGIAYAAEGRHEEALLAFRRAVALDCDNQAALANLATAEATAAGETP